MVERVDLCFEAVVLRVDLFNEALALVLLGHGLSGQVLNSSEEGLYSGSMIFKLLVEGLESALEQALEELQGILLYFVELGRVLGSMAVEVTHYDV